MVVVLLSILGLVYNKKLSVLYAIFNKTKINVPDILKLAQWTLYAHYIHTLHITCYIIHYILLYIHLST